MANTYTQVYIHFVFVVKGRENLIHPVYNDELQRFITGIIQNRGNKLLAINNMPDHMHLLTGLNPTNSLSDLMESVKSVSSKFINEQRWVRKKFEWQRGYGAFSYAKSDLPGVIQYILRQQQHHQKNSFHNEYMDLLEQFGIQFNEKYLFDWIE